MIVVMFSIFLKMSWRIYSLKKLLRMIASSNAEPTEHQFRVETFALLNILESIQLCKSRAVRIKVMAQYVVGENIAQRLQFGLK